jgi:hypothetical protein
MSDAPKTILLAPNGGLPTGNYPKSELVHFTRTDTITSTDAYNAGKAAGVRVKPLVWEGFRAGPYWIEVEAGGLAHLFCAYDRDDEGVEAIKGGYLTLVSIDDLKVAAQADYEARIMAALEPAPAGVTVQEAAKVLLEADEWMPQKAKLAAVKAHLERDSKIQPVAVGAAWRAALRALSGDRT